MKCHINFSSCSLLILYVPISYSVCFSFNQVYSEESPVIIFDALAGHLHQVQVRGRDEVNPDSQWSEWSPLLLVWPWSGEEENSQFAHFLFFVFIYKYAIHSKTFILCIYSLNACVSTAVYTTPDPAEDLPEDFSVFYTKAETSTAKSHSKTLVVLIVIELSL